MESKTAPEVPEQEEPGYRDVLPTINIQEFHEKLRVYTKFALGAFKNLPEAEEVTIKVGIPILAEGSTQGNFEIEVKCKFPDRNQNSSNS